MKFKIVVLTTDKMMYEGYVIAENANVVADNLLADPNIESMSVKKA